jgi:hypothetical protein
MCKGNVKRNAFNERKNSAGKTVDTNSLYHW